MTTHNTGTTRALPQESLKRSEEQKHAVLWAQVQLDTFCSVQFPAYLYHGFIFSMMQRFGGFACLRALPTPPSRPAMFPLLHALSRARVPDLLCARLQNAEQSQRTKQHTLEQMEERGRRLHKHAQHPENIAMKHRALIDAAQNFCQQQQRQLDQEAARAGRSKCTYAGISFVLKCVRLVRGRLVY